MSASFGSQLGSVMVNYSKLCDRVVGEALVGIVEELVDRTPVNTGEAVSNYFCGDALGSDVSGEISESGEPSLARAKTFSRRAKFGDRVYVYNNVAHILDLEYGTSAKAPSGMSRSVVAKWRKIGEEAVERAKSK